MVSVPLDVLKQYFGLFVKMGLWPVHNFLSLARLVSTLPTNAAQLLLGQLDEALAERELLWHNVLSGTEDAMQDLPHSISRARSRHHS